VRERREYRFRVHSAAVFTLYSYSKTLKYHFRVPTAGSLRGQDIVYDELDVGLVLQYSVLWIDVTLSSGCGSCYAVFSFMNWCNTLCTPMATAWLFISGQFALTRYHIKTKLFFAFFECKA
jgi:hypothetical protein